MHHLVKIPGKRTHDINRTKRQLSEAFFFVMIFLLQAKIQRFNNPPSLRTQPGDNNFPSIIALLKINAQYCMDNWIVKTHYSPKPTSVADDILKPFLASGLFYHDSLDKSIFYVVGREIDL